MSNSNTQSYTQYKDFFPTIEEYNDFSLIFSNFTTILSEECNLEFLNKEYNPSEKNQLLEFWSLNYMSINKSKPYNEYIFDVYPKLSTMDLFNIVKKFLPCIYKQEAKQELKLILNEYERSSKLFEKFEYLLSFVITIK